MLSAWMSGSQPSCRFTASCSWSSVCHAELLPIIGSFPGASLRLRASTDERLVESRVVTVDVFREVNRAVLGHDHCCGVEQQHLDWPREPDAERLCTGHCRQNPIARPLSVVLERPFGKRNGIFYTHAAMTEVASAFVEQLCRRRCMQVNIRLVRDHELDEPQRVPGARALSQSKRPALESCEVLRCRLDSSSVLTRPPQDFHVLTLEVLGIASKLWQNLVAHNRLRNVPVRPENHFTHLGE